MMFLMNIAADFLINDAVHCTSKKKHTLGYTAPNSGKKNKSLWAVHFRIYSAKHAYSLRFSLILSPELFIIFLKTSMPESFESPSTIKKNFNFISKIQNRKINENKNFFLLLPISSHYGYFKHRNPKHYPKPSYLQLYTRK